MSDLSEVVATVIETPIQVEVDTGTPVITITNATNPSDITIISPQAVTATIVDHKPEVHVRVGMGGGNLLDTEVLLFLLRNSVSIEQLTPELIAYIDGVYDTSSGYSDSLYDLLNAAIISLQNSVTNNHSASTSADADLALLIAQLEELHNSTKIGLQTYIDENAGGIVSVVSKTEEIDGIITQLQTSITQTAADIVSEATARTVLENGIISTHTSLINQNAFAITQEVTERKNDVITLSSTITQTADSITQEVIDRTNAVASLSSTVTQTAASITQEVIDRQALEDGIIAEHTSLITQTAFDISQEVTARTTLENGAVLQNTSNITQTAASLITTIESLDLISGRLNTAEETLTAYGYTLNILSTSLDEHGNTLESIQTQTANKFSVVLSEKNAYGEQYVAGFQLALHPEWELGVSYVEDDWIELNGSVYGCLLAHTASTLNSPESASAATYWALIPGTEKTEFYIAADHFKIIRPDNFAVSLFEVKSDGTVLIDGTLALSNIIGTDGILNITNNGRINIQAADGMWVTGDGALVVDSERVWVPFNEATDFTHGIIAGSTGSGSGCVMNSYGFLTFASDYNPTTEVWTQYGIHCFALGAMDWQGMTIGGGDMVIGGYNIPAVMAGLHWDQSLAEFFLRGKFTATNGAQFVINTSQGIMVTGGNDITLDATYPEVSSIFFSQAGVDKMEMSMVGSNILGIRPIGGVAPSLYLGESGNLFYQVNMYASDSASISTPSLFVRNPTDVTKGTVILGSVILSDTGDGVFRINGSPITSPTKADIDALGVTAAEATKLVTARTFDITGDITATAQSFDGTGNVSIFATVNNDSHTHSKLYYGATMWMETTATDVVSHRNIRPGTNEVWALGDATFSWYASYIKFMHAKTLYYETGEIQTFEVFDDLKLLSAMAPLRNPDGSVVTDAKGYGVMDRKNIAHCITNAHDLPKILKKEYGVDLTLWEIDNIREGLSPAVIGTASGDNETIVLVDAEKIENLIYYDAGKAVQLAYGAIRQLDKEITENVLEEVNGMLEYLVNENNLLKQRITALEPIEIS